jgi:hypothetical protein
MEEVGAGTEGAGRDGDMTVYIVLAEGGGLGNEDEVPGAV